MRCWGAWSSQYPQNMPTEHCQDPYKMQLRPLSFKTQLPQEEMVLASLSCNCLVVKTFVSGKLWFNSPFHLRRVKPTSPTFMKKSLSYPVIVQSEKGTWLKKGRLLDPLLNYGHILSEAQQIGCSHSDFGKQLFWFSAHASGLLPSCQCHLNTLGNLTLKMILYCLYDARYRCSFFPAHIFIFLKKSYYAMMQD